MRASPTPPQPRIRTQRADAADDPRREEGAAEYEWLETDGRGGYACSTASLVPSRRYHGLLVAPLPGTAKRHLFLARLLERLPDDDAWTGEDGELRLRPWPCTTFRRGDAKLDREILMPRGRHAVLVRYTLRGKDELDLELEPLLAFRDADALTWKNDVLDEAVEVGDRGLCCRPYDALPAMEVTLDGSASWSFVPHPRWHRGVTYATDLARGYDGEEDLFAPGRLRIRLREGVPFTLAATIEAPVAEPGALFEAETERRGDAADDFLYEGLGGRTGILAGFPWFGEWGRDTFIALPGLTLARKQVDACGDVLLGALPWLRGGLLPNIFGASPDDSHYGSVDAALWFARAVRLYERAGGDRARVRDVLLPALERIADAYREGTALGIRADGNLLIRVGSPELNPTWMDAQVAAGPVTPRHGYPVEIQALWCSLLIHLARLTGSADRRADAARACEAFLARFWRPEEGILADVWHEDGADESVRPNMVLAAALELSPLDRAQRRSIVARAEAELLTPYGLRTLSPSDPDYRGRYRGGPEERDRAYHQGTVWPWLLGFFCEASLRADDAAANRARLGRLWDGLDEELGRGGLRHLAEVYDGDPPHRRGGSFAQAWNTAEAMRAKALLDGSLSLGGGETA